MGELANDIAPFTIHKFEGLDFSSSQGDGTVDLRPDPKAEKDGQHIDWILYRNNSDLQIKPLKYEVMTDRIPDGPYLSDHFPVSVTFGIERRTSFENAVWHESQDQNSTPSDGPIR